MAIHERAGTPVTAAELTNIPNLVSQFYMTHPDPDLPGHKVVFGTSGHRGTSLDGSFTEAHILAITQAVCEYRKRAGITGPIFLGKDTHALSDPAEKVALEVLAANQATVLAAGPEEFVPTPAVSHAILAHNRGRSENLADGLILTPSHNPPTDGGIKYNPPNGGPAEKDITGWIADRANDILSRHLADVKRLRIADRNATPGMQRHDFMTPYVRDLPSVIDMDRIRQAGVRICADALGGSALAYWDAIREQFGLDIALRNADFDPTFRFMCLDHDGKIRMDCSSPYAMAGLVDLKDKFDIAFANDPDADRHGIVTPTGGLMNPNHFLAVAIWYLFQHRPDWPPTAAVGKTLVSSSIIDRVTAGLGRTLREVPVGFKWFVNGLLDGSLGFGGEESAGASFLRRDGTVWTTDKDGIILDLLAAEILAVTGKDPAQHYADLTAQFGTPVYQRIDAPATPDQKALLKKLSPDQVPGDTLAGEPIVAKMTEAPGNGAPIGGLKVRTENGWFAARPSGTEDIYKIYAESFQGKEHLPKIQNEARQIVQRVFDAE